MGVRWELVWGGRGAWCVDVVKWLRYQVCTIRDVRPKIWEFRGQKRGWG